MIKVHGLKRLFENKENLDYQYEKRKISNS